MLPEFPNLKWIHFGSIGISDIRSSEAKERRILVTNSKGTSEKAVALTALGFLLGLTRGLKVSSELSAQSKFSRESFDDYFGNISDFSEFYNVLILGYGEIGRIFGSYLTCFGIQYDVVVADKKRKRYGGYKATYELQDLDEIVGQYDAIVNILPLTDLTKGIFNSSKFDRMKAKSFFINVGRGETVIEDDLIRAIIEKKISGAGLDVFQKEPLDNSSPLHKLSNVIITPHIGAMSRSYWNKEFSLFSENLELFMSNKKMKNIIDLNKGY
ncbi:hypothetical protein JWG44_16900 [Leptospira sp. 201903071]|uniref:NAD(P)-dependent oxidoreductase n=1 Tax=Leptospira ainazelensis TaxID=2810034 RepID=UPI001964BF16|nr:hypothetical protein [Leptospira ainazelensis]